MSRRLRGWTLAVVAALLPLPAVLPALPAAAATPIHDSGTTANGAWVLDAPADFNGTLLVWSHGYTFTPVGAADAPTSATRDALLGLGYALIGSSYAGGGAGWATKEGVRAGVEAVATARRELGDRVQHVYAWGNSLGGLITQTIAESHPDLVDGVAPLCGVLAGTNKNLDLALDLSAAVKVFWYPKLQLTGYTSAADAQANVDAAMASILGRLADPAKQPGTVARLLGLTALTAASAKTQNFSGATLNSSVAAAVETLQTALTYSTVGRYDIEQRVGGNPSSNIGVDYRNRVTPAATARFTAFGFSAGLLKAYARTLQTYSKRVAPDKAARKAAYGLGNPLGTLTDPTVTMHTQYDPLVIVQNEAVFVDRVGIAGRAALLHQLWVSPPATYADGSPSIANDGAPYGAGHCNFSTGNYVAAVSTLDHWVRTGSYQAPAETGGLRTSLSVPVWPAH
jgi:pimeloyl-ACP methyl ester carboxylesterase